MEILILQKGAEDSQSSDDNTVEADFEEVQEEDK